jgi:hypothetical protein
LGLALGALAGGWIWVAEDRARWQRHLDSSQSRFLVGDLLANPYVHLRALGRWERVERNVQASAQRLISSRSVVDGREVVRVQFLDAE